MFNQIQYKTEQSIERKTLTAGLVAFHLASLMPNFTLGHLLLETLTQRIVRMCAYTGSKINQTWAEDHVGE